MSDATRGPVDRRLLIALAAIAGVALLVFVFSLFGGSDEGDDEVITVPDRGEPTASPQPGVETDDDALYPETTEVFAARDPFDQLVRPAGQAGDSGGTGTGGGTTPTTSPGTGGSGTGGSGSGSGGSGSGSGTGSGSGSSAQVGGTEIKLIDTYEKDGMQRALVTVNGRSYDVAEGDKFAERFRLLDVSGDCATFLFGDSRFVLCEGDEIRK